MGTDATIYVERKLNQYWWTARIMHDCPRDYDLFAWLGWCYPYGWPDVLPPIDQPRGLPDDARGEIRDDTDGHVVTWFLLSELLTAVPPQEFRGYPWLMRELRHLEQLGPVEETRLVFAFG